MAHAPPSRGDGVSDLKRRGGGGDGRTRPASSLFSAVFSAPGSYLGHARNIAEAFVRLGRSRHRLSRTDENGADDFANVLLSLSLSLSLFLSVLALLPIFCLSRSHCSTRMSTNTGTDAHHKRRDSHLSSPHPERGAMTPAARTGRLTTPVLSRAPSPLDKSGDELPLGRARTMPVKSQAGLGELKVLNWS